MIFTKTALKDAFVVDVEKKPDHRGFFARGFCAQEFISHGLKPTVAQCNISFNHKKGTVRGMHYQISPAAETKLVRCTQGAIYDVIIDMRPESPTFLSHIGVELTAQNHRALYVPEMFAHGYQTLTDETEVVYQVGEFYTPGYERGLRYNDPFFNIEWPLETTEISHKDLNWTLLEMIPVGSTDSR
ncbi:dTDP-4-dehydrorhamnose 3,5-epimerase [Umezakia ovalisporum]|jgi:dTDP-4-dehydrorhamnose 3,5-epimerase|uniref:dTDP-4-dehydrorhamnose 3,5-epimerase n=2 Tax=Umezakia ovalisporum TaxID=75695 RepID=A0AA43GZN9_9CYAN|nr:dTDP-4-dehydrorhamnose 3,5-epimerase [Umezakia ovalisporum]MBI1241387.1 dTDP-4-dehydrorhamnose 3,5-epimerase [Nostoc sp. RI_552]MDH6057179.1 dTDP-4-dehydrorhamnose 3,5-epimerase [Umezakia ovalisporum FSS-43]MDH6064627.1 dTDP-4-dehydrorhamnose 3,5-epimerase [Umezakia ovalisporum FSS-62]MDH6069029.1 dTDP-4-dehydrorhamnose 3,5-epimerase [Umezakia ovalisporum APH033B]MDH6071719.1 dTDP-4-dehydrorhamnose 3,5-epimerase [Umezakia ovalisporum CobakiLakeA]